MRRRRIEVVIAFLDIFAVVSLAIGQAEEALLDDWIAPIPQRDSKAQPAFAIADSQKPIFPPAIRPASRMVVRQVIPALPVGGVVFSNRPPLPLGQIRPPPLPVFFAVLVLVKTDVLCD